MNELVKDSQKQIYIEVAVNETEFFRITSIENGGYDCPCLRIQIRDSNGRLRQGPEIPKSKAMELIGAIGLLYHLPLSNENLLFSE